MTVKHDAEKTSENESNIEACWGTSNTEVNMKKSCGWYHPKWNKYVDEYELDKGSSRKSFETKAEGSETQYDH